MTVGKFTPREIEGATKGARDSGEDVWLTDPGARGEGRFMCRCTAAGERNAENVVVLRDMPEVAARYEAEWQRLRAESEGWK